MDRKTAGKYLSEPERLKQPRPARDWRTRVDPLTEIWPEAELRLQTAPELEAKALFEHLQVLRSEPFPSTLLRTFQRRVRQWRLVHGPAPEVIFPQTHSPGEVLQLDWTHAKELAVSIAGHPLDHLLCQAVLPYSNWQWATRCQSESLLSLRAGLQAALFRLGKVPKLLQIDNSSAATHQISGEGKRDFNPEFLSLTEHYGLAVRTIHVGCPNENGDVESHNGHLKRRLEQHLLLRGYRDFVNEAAYDQFVAEVLAKANRPRTAKVAEELAVMRELPPTRLCEYDEVECQVCSHSTIRVKRVTYSVPARFIGRRVRARVYEQRLEVYHGPDQIAHIARQPGRQAVIDYRHVIQALLRKPGGFARYRYREELFPSSTYRRAYDRLVQDHGPGPGELEYLRLLKLTADLGSSAIEGLLSEFLALASPPWRTATLRNLLCPPNCVELVEPPVDFSVYDAFLGSEATRVA
jgi:transposase